MNDSKTISIPFRGRTLDGQTRDFPAHALARVYLHMLETTQPYSGNMYALLEMPTQTPLFVEVYELCEEYDRDTRSALYYQWVSSSKERTAS